MQKTSATAKSMAALKRHLRALGPWRAAAALLATGLLVYYGALGLRYWRATEETASLTDQIRQLSGEQASPSRGRAAPQAHETPLDDLHESFSYPRLEELRRQFSPAERDALVAIVTATARGTGARLLSVAMGDPQPKSYAGVRFQAQPVAISVQGETSAITSFLSTLRQRIPVVGFSGVSMAGMEGAPSAYAQLVLYLSPEPEPKKEKGR